VRGQLDASVVLPPEDKSPLPVEVEARWASEQVLLL